MDSGAVVDAEPARLERVLRARRRGSPCRGPRARPSPSPASSRPGPPPCSGRGTARPACRARLRRPRSGTSCSSWRFFHSRSSKLDRLTVTTTGYCDASSSRVTSGCVTRVDTSTTRSACGSTSSAPIARRSLSALTSTPSWPSTVPRLVPLKVTSASWAGWFTASLDLLDELLDRPVRVGHARRQRGLLRVVAGQPAERARDDVAFAALVERLLHHPLRGDAQLGVAPRSAGSAASRTSRRAASGSGRASCSSIAWPRLAARMPPTLTPPTVMPSAIRSSREASYAYTPIDPPTSMATRKTARSDERLLSHGLPSVGTGIPHGQRVPGTAIGIARQPAAGTRPAPSRSRAARSAARARPTRARAAPRALAAPSSRAGR